MPISLRGLARGLARIDYALTHMSVANGHVNWSDLGAPTIEFGDDGAGTCPDTKSKYLPSTAGATQYQVLQLDADLQPEWDWVRVSVPE